MSRLYNANSAWPILACSSRPMLANTARPDALPSPRVTVPVIAALLSVALPIRAVSVVPESADRCRSASVAR